VWGFWEFGGGCELFAARVKPEYLFGVHDSVLLTTTIRGLVVDRIITPLI